VNIKVNFNFELGISPACLMAAAAIVKAIFLRLP
jgi:hypothetical protein